MSRKLKALAALNILGWIVAVPLLLFAVVDPFIDFPTLPTRLGESSGGTVQLDSPSRSTSPSRAAERDNSDALRAARDALTLVTSGSAAPIAVAPSLGGAPGSADDRAGTVGQLRARVVTPQSNGTPPAAKPPAAPGSPPATTPPATPPATTPPTPTVPTPPAEAVPSRTPPAPESPQEPESPAGGPDGEDTPPPPESPAPVPETPGTPETPAPPTEDPPPPEIPAPPGDEETPGPEGPETPAPPPEEPAPPMPETPAPVAPAAPEDPPEDPDDKPQIPAAVKPPHEDMPHTEDLGSGPVGS